MTVKIPGVLPPSFSISLPSWHAVYPYPFEDDETGEQSEEGQIWGASVTSAIRANLDLPQSQSFPFAENLSELKGQPIQVTKTVKKQWF